MALRKVSVMRIEEGMDEEGICYEEEYLRYLVLFPTSKWVAGLVFYENG